MVFAPSYSAPGDDSKGDFLGEKGASRKCDEMMRSDDGRCRHKPPRNIISGTNKEEREGMSQESEEFESTMESGISSPKHIPSAPEYIYMSREYNYTSLDAGKFFSSKCADFR